ncbi:cation transporter [Ginsengibacter hankyongi]|uniref:cation transporter n=1 Tax=Ginsengibacter hankyongi TaxID=2607284 RepID=UPI0029394D4E|nr:cation transporter [Ginsengibacter hankyongi]
MFTIIYNIGEGVASLYFGFEDGSLALFGFGADSFIEVLSGLGIAHMVLRIQRNPHSIKDDFERSALRITGFSFYTLVAGLVTTSIYNTWTNHNPRTTFAGIIVSVISIMVMWALIMLKTKVGKNLNSQAILADAQCTKVCIYMSIVLLFSSGIYEILHIPYLDNLGSLGLSYFSFKEGRECFEKAKSNKDCCCK